VDETPLLLTIDEAAQQLRLSRAFTYELAARNEIPVVRFGRRVLVPKAALDDLIAGGPTQSAALPATIER
jgi:excisionase family DNA binding protein